MKGGHGGERVALERMVKRPPETPPEALARLGHDPAHRRHLAVRAGLPGRRGRHDPVDHAAQVEARRHQHGRARELVAVAQQHVQRACRAARRTSSSARPRARTRAARRGPRGRAPAGAWSVGQRAQAEHPVAADRIAHLQPRRAARPGRRPACRSARSTPTSGGRRCPRRAPECGGQPARARRGPARTAPTPPAAAAAAGAGPGAWRRPPPPRPTRAFAGREYFAKLRQHNPRRVR